MAQTVGAIIDRVKRILQEKGDDGIRWKNSELIDWLNEAYTLIATHRPDAFSVVDDIELSEGVEQRLPDDGLRLFEILATVDGHDITAIDLLSLTRLRPSWRRESATTHIERYIYDLRDPTRFWVYPPAESGVAVLAWYAAEPEPHDRESLNAIHEDAIRVEATYAPVLVDYMLYRAFSKDAEGEANQQRASNHLQAATQALEMKAQGDGVTAPQGGGNDARRTDR